MEVCRNVMSSLIGIRHDVFRCLLIIARIRLWLSHQTELRKGKSYFLSVYSLLSTSVLSKCQNLIKKNSVFAQSSCISNNCADPECPFEINLGNENGS